MTKADPAGASELDAVARYRRAVDYLAAAQIYLKKNPLLEEPLAAEHIKERLLGHWGTAPGINLVCAHLNRLIRKTDASVLLITGPGHGAAANMANMYIEGTMTEFYPEYTRDRAGMARFVKAFSWPYGFPEPPLAGAAGRDPRGGRARLRARDRVRRGARQPGPRRRLHRRGRRGGDGTDGHGVARQQVLECRDRRRRAADPSLERIQDRESHRSRPRCRSRSWRASTRDSGTRSGSSTRAREIDSDLDAAFDWAYEEIRRTAGARALGQAGRAARLAADRAANAQGARLPARRSTGRCSRGPSGPTRSRSRIRRRTRRTWRFSRNGSARTGPRSSSTAMGNRRPTSCRSARRRERRIAMNSAELRRRPARRAGSPAARAPRRLTRGAGRSDASAT